MVTLRSHSQESTGRFLLSRFFFTNVINVFNVIDDSYLFAIIANSFYCSVLSEQIKELNKQVDQLEVYLW